MRCRPACHTVCDVLGHQDTCVCVLQHPKLALLRLPAVMQGGRGRGFGDFDDRPPPSFGPDREAPLGSAARPGQQVSLQTSGESTITVERAYTSFPEALKVLHLMLQCKWFH